MGCVEIQRSLPRRGKRKGLAGRELVSQLVDRFGLSHAANAHLRSWAHPAPSSTIKQPPSPAQEARATKPSFQSFTLTANFSNLKFALCKYPKMTGSNSYMARRKALAQVARETKAMTPNIATTVPHLEPTVSHLVDLTTLPLLDPAKCPRFVLSDTENTCGTLIRVKDHDSFDAGILMPTSVLGTASGKTTQETESAHLGVLKTAALAAENLNAETAARVAVLNMASEKSKPPCSPATDASECSVS